MLDLQKRRRASDEWGEVIEMRRLIDWGMFMCFCERVVRNGIKDMSDARFAARKD